MRLHILVEGPSEEAFLKNWLPRFLGPSHTFRVIVHQGKGKLPKNLESEPDRKHRGLLDQLPVKLRAYGKQLKPDTDRVVVLVDLDTDHCVDLLAQLNIVLSTCNPPPYVIFRIAIEETEAFFLGDSSAIKRAYPSAKIAKLKKHAFDSICGTWEKLQEIINDGLDSPDKVAWASSIGQHLGVKFKGKSANKSMSFVKFCEGLKRACGDK